ncbi:general substrate transporter [Ganoderma leucocontextum]|nr:general substrate transporter [Ganoderma leucocontextum]
MSHIIMWRLLVAAAPVLVTEIAYPSHRAPATSLYNTLWFLGSITAYLARIATQLSAAWTTFGTFNVPTSWAWRIPSAIQALPSVIQVFLVWFIPESPRWLCLKGREEEALRILAYYHSNGNRTDPLVEYEFEEIRAAIQFDKEIAADVGWLSLVRTPGNRRRLRIMVAIAFFSQWSGNNLISSRPSESHLGAVVTDPNTQLLLNGILNIYNFVIAIIAGLLCDKIGRRPLSIASTIGMFMFWVLQTACFAVYSETGNITAAHTFVAMICTDVVLRPVLFYAFYDIAFTPLIVSYTVEILPFTLRAKGFTVFNFSLTLSLIFNQYINPIALNALGWKYYIVYACWLVFEIGFIWCFLIETKNRTLEETAALFDGNHNADMLAQHAAVNTGVTISDQHSDPEKGPSEDIIEEVKT